MTRPLSEPEERLIESAVARMRGGVMAVVFGMVGGVGWFLATAWLLIRGGQNVGQTLGLMRNYFPGYSVTWTGSLVALAYGTLVGAILGWSLARIYNWLATRRHSGEE